MSEVKTRKKKIISVVGSPFEEDELEGLPWEYGIAAFIGWVDEVLLEGYKKPTDAPLPTLEEAIDAAETAGYDLEFNWEREE